MIGQIDDATGKVAKRRNLLLEDGIGEFYQALLRRLHWPPALNGGNGSTAGRELACLGITSSGRREGVSTIAWQLAAAAAEADAGNILLVDANPAHPGVHETFHVELGPGLAESLLDSKRLEESIGWISGSNLSVLPLGKATRESVRAFNSSAIDEIVGVLRAHFDLVVFDMPPTNERSTSLRLAALVDGVLMVVEAERACREAVRRATRILERGGSRVLGAVLNKRRPGDSGWLR